MPTWLIIAITLYTAATLVVLVRFLVEDRRLHQDTDWLSAVIASVVWPALYAAWVCQDLARWWRGRHRRARQRATRRSIRKFGKGV